jgi:hypothetical protein
MPKPLSAFRSKNDGHDQKRVGYLIAKDAKEAHGAESNTKIRHDAGNELEKS